MSAGTGKFDEELESWKEFPYALRRDDREAWDRMVKEARERFGDAIERAGKTFNTEPFFMALLLLQQSMIEHVKAELEATGADLSGMPGANMTLDMWDSSSGDVIGRLSGGSLSERK
ncbi:MAG: hypothetical protein JRN34_00250 [Nitrososphaerota archaeon]|nr:hypothetical protein [Nitrososphaerota archaeon]MDG6943164.1 hypothetical protein [Nitrososphaerota archaeon]MDG6950958.1 hypothetical protein [Nitrososphaerota archaeon]